MPRRALRPRQGRLRRPESPAGAGGRSPGFSRLEADLAARQASCGLFEPLLPEPVRGRQRREPSGTSPPVHEAMDARCDRLHARLGSDRAKSSEIAGGRSGCSRTEIGAGPRPAAGPDETEDETDCLRAWRRARRRPFAGLSTGTCRRCWPSRGACCGTMRRPRMWRRRRCCGSGAMRRALELGEGGVRPWLRRVASNLCIDRVRAKRNTTVVDDGAGGERAGAADAGSWPSGSSARASMRR